MKRECLALLLLAACSRREVTPRGTTDSAARQANAGQVTRAAAPSPESDAGVAGNVVLRLVAEPAQTAKTWRIVAKAAGLSLNTEVTTFVEPWLCGITPILSEQWARKNITNNVKTPPAILITCSGDDPGVVVSAQNAVLKIGVGSYLIPSNVQLVLPFEIEQPPPPGCIEGGLPKTIDLKLSRRAAVSSSGQLGKVFDIDLLLLAERIRLGTVANSPMNCSTSRTMSQPAQVSYNCSYAESGFSVKLSAELQRLWIEWTQRGYHKSEAGSRFGRQLPCVTQVRFQQFALRDSDWKPFGSSCALNCSDQRDRCDEQCYQRQVNGAGHASAVGLLCTEKCRSQFDKCNHACADRGQYP